MRCPGDKLISGEVGKKISLWEFMAFWWNAEGTGHGTSGCFAFHHDLLKGFAGNAELAEAILSFHSLSVGEVQGGGARG